MWRALCVRARRCLGEAERVPGVAGPGLRRCLLNAGRPFPARETFPRQAPVICRPRPPGAPSPPPPAHPSASAFVRLAEGCSDVFASPAGKCQDGQRCEKPTLGREQVRSVARMTNSSSAATSSTTGESLLLLCEEEESWAGRRIPVSLLYSGLAIGGTLANGMVIYLVSSFRKLQTTSNAFIVNGCAADLSVCALWMPQEAVLGLLPAGSAEPPGDWGGAGGSYRLLRGGLLGLGLTVSLLSHCLVALNRYLLITRAPATYQVLYQRRHTAGMLALSWALALALVLLLPPWAPREPRSRRPGRGDARALAGRSRQPALEEACPTWPSCASSCSAGSALGAREPEDLTGREHRAESSRKGLLPPSTLRSV
ncbi:PREDICTED: probable G-protein coupled receptor 88 [Chinchilla lanigera]|uniref:probable G-protein coupled receptor 88 n=1 Tax=Chinchilla lanigera TaxID=34839 RepID=UPI00038E9C3F|nr:PREDICTED: probable G-protein coupled receptor 88 [Chinchilla lanigera]